MESEDRRKTYRLMGLPLRDYYMPRNQRRVMQTVAVCALLFCAIVLLVVGQCFSAAALR